jgi:hypothetical protein
LSDIAKLDGGGVHQGVLAIYRAIIRIADAELAAFWDLIPVETRPDAVNCINQAATKLAALSAAEQLARIVRTHKGSKS